jgi:hypothetical protein
VYLCPPDYQIGFKFYSSSLPQNCYSIIRDGGALSNARFIQATALLRANPWISAIAGNKDKQQRKFVAERDAIKGLWLIKLSPAFEIRVPRANVPDQKGIYQYRKENEVVYLGRGNIKDRCMSAERKDWVFDTVEFSVIHDSENQKLWECFWINKFVEIYGRLPIYNQIGAGDVTVI